MIRYWTLWRWSSCSLLLSASFTIVSSLCSCRLDDIGHCSLNSLSLPQLWRTLSCRQSDVPGSARSTRDWSARRRLSGSSWRRSRGERRSSDKKRRSPACGKNRSLSNTTPFIERRWGKILWDNSVAVYLTCNENYDILLGLSKLAR